MSKTRRTLVETMVDRHFAPPHATRAAVGVVKWVICTGVVMTFARLLPEPYSWVAWAWVVYRCVVFGVAVSLLERYARELARRMDWLDPVLRAALRGDAFSEAAVEVERNSIHPADRAVR